MKQGKRWLILLLGVMVMSGLVGCGKPRDGQEQTAMQEITVGFVNEVTEADVWVLPQTPENLKTTLWGAATVSGLAAGERKELRLSRTAEDQVWMVRILDRDHGYYAARDLVLDEGYCIEFRSDGDRLQAVLRVLDRDGKEVSSQGAFVGTLGGR